MATEDDDYKGFKFDESRIASLFENLDVNRDGKIDVRELKDGLKRLGIRHVPGQAAQIIERGDITDDNHLSFDEFMKYCVDHEKKLWLVFKSIDTDNTGTISESEIHTAFESLGVNVEGQEVKRLMKCMDKDGSLQVDWKEWRDFHFLNPNTDSIKDIIKFWRHSSMIDIGDDMVVPDEFTEEEIVSGVWWRQLVAGGAAGIVSRTCTAPLDRLKIFLQVQAGSHKRPSILGSFTKMLAEGGPRSLWRGNAINCIKIAPESAIKFMAYERIKTFVKGDAAQLSGWERLLSGSLAGVVSQSSIYPMEVMKTRLALGKTGQYRGIVHAAKTIYVKEGLRTFYKGLIPSLLGIMPYAGIDLAVYESLKGSWLKHHQKQSADPGTLVLLFCGTASSTCGQLASYPLALVRTKLQAQSKEALQGGKLPDGMFSMFRSIIKENGPFGLYRGLAPNFLKVAPAVSISYVVYENLRKYLGLEEMK